MKGKYLIYTITAAGGIALALINRKKKNPALLVITNGVSRVVDQMGNRLKGQILRNALLSLVGIVVLNKVYHKWI